LHRNGLIDDATHEELHIALTVKSLGGAESLGELRAL
jgi:hypothetical protein